MRLRLSALVVLALGTVPVITFAQGPVLSAPARAAADRITAPQLAWDVARLASDDLKGRNTPSPGFDAAADYLIARLQRAGLTPAGDQGGFRQYYDLDETRLDTARAALTIGARRFEVGRDVAMRTLGIPKSGTVPVVYVGHGWTVPERGIDSFAGVDVNGALVLAHGPRVTPTGVAISQVGRVTVGARSVVDEAARRGAVGVLFITQAGELLRWDDLRSGGQTRREMVPNVPSAYATPDVPSLLLSPDATRAMLEGEAFNGDAALQVPEGGPYPSSFRLRKTVTLDLPLAQSTRLRPFNVVARLEGTDPTLRAEVVTVAAHLDGAVGTREVAGDAIYNAADDNASGSAGLLAIAEQMVTARPKRSIVFVWDSGEEQGLWGIRWFVHTPPVPRGAIVAHVNVDMIGSSRPDTASPPEGVKGVTRRGEVYMLGPTVLSRQADALITRVNAEYQGLQLNRAFDRTDSEYFYPRTDAGPFLERGILTIGFNTGTHERYHLPSDEARALDPVQMQQVARLMFSVVWAVGDAPQRIGIDQPMPASVPRHP
jgi:Zn-dependent M28 family amino/carboxypeptidase